MTGKFCQNEADELETAVQCVDGPRFQERNEAEPRRRHGRLKGERVSAKYGRPLIMSDTNIQLTRKQQEILLRGLRYVRSSVALEQQDWNEEVENKRQMQYREISDLEGMVNSAQIVGTATV